ncbi:chemotaxis protein [Brasilonema octagenarum UFV-E1]|uniref:Chemotaxis protein n=1 Tax=Brasilonema sennae CENA114 TaxID=415709 RepID=A0A856MF22_9CYAN|nr:GAF domain-containing protein [Brasilonema sennae]QDL09793.1 chemotaxis protein [Brasilonema sennae CENA114]QDL16146.1 chemotaxis protein [Brasilonema octagenarum UFV-E1]
MTQPSSQKQAEQQLNQSKGLQESADPKQRPQEWSLKTKAIAWAMLVSMLPVLTVGTTTYYFGSQLTAKQISQARQADTTSLAEAELGLHRLLSLLLIETGVTAVLAGAIAAILGIRAIRPILNAASVSTTMVNRLRRESADSGTSIVSKDELAVLETNINFVKEQLPDLLWKQEAEAERSQVFHNISRGIRQSLTQEDVLRTTVEEVRKALRIDRVAIFRFDSNLDGTFVEESAAPELPKILWTTISDPCFQTGYVEQYRNGRVRAIDDIYQANLTDCHIGLLERFAVKSNLIAPILKNNQLFGLLIAHQCFEPRTWQQYEIDLFAQIAAQVGFALDYVKLLERIDTKADQAQAFINITRRIRESLNEEDVLKATVEETRKVLSADRVLVYGFDSNWYGTVVAESVLPGFPKALRAKIKDPCFVEGYVEKYQAGRVQATNNIYEAGLTTCHISQLEPFAVRANLVASILKDNQLFALLIAHQCSGPRDWQQYEIDLFTQIATQVGFALDHARLVQRIDAEGVQTQLLADMTRSIRESLNEEDVLKTTVEKTRKAMSADRVLVYGFDSNWYGTVIAESVLPGFPKALRAKIKDPCFAEGYVEKYRFGRVQATNNIYEAGLTTCHISQLEPFAVKANLVAPILKDDQLFGLLIAHQCSGPRDWQQYEIDLFTQIATQVGFALDHARLLNKVEQAYQSAEATSYEQREQKEALQLMVLELLRGSQTSVQTLSGEALSQVESLTGAYNQIQALVDSAMEMLICAQQAELQEQQLTQAVHDGHSSIDPILENLCDVQVKVMEAVEKVERLDQPFQKFSQLVGLISHIAFQIKLQAMNTVLEASRTTEGGEQFAWLADQALSQVHQLEASIAEVQLLVPEIQTQANEVVAVIEYGAEQAMRGIRLAQETQEKFNQIIMLSEQMKKLVEELVQTAPVQAKTSTSASQSILEVVSIASKTSEQVLAVAKSLDKLSTLAQNLQEDAD